MNSIQYEELCRFFLSEKIGVPATEILSVKIPNPQRPGLPEYQHQIDLYWETGDDLAQYLNIANAKWRGSDPVDQPEVMLLQQVKQKVAAHKAFMLTSVGFTSGAVAAAKDDGIALHIVRPALDVARLPTNDRSSIGEQLALMASAEPETIYTHEVVHRALGFGGRPSAATASANRAMSGYTTRTATGGTTRTVGGYSNRSVGGGGGGKGGAGGTRSGFGFGGGGGIVKK